MRLNLEQTLDSGQVFLWHKAGRYWYGVDGQDVLKCDNTGIVKTHSGRMWDYFRDGDACGMRRSASRDGAVSRAAAQYPGLRILRQDPFQCCISFIASANSSIQKIRYSLGMLCGLLGRTVRFDGMEFSLFPTHKEIAGSSPGTIRACGLGYRARYVRDAARMIRDGAVDLEALKIAGYSEARQQLLGIPGVGSKVADCILLFSLEKTCAFPLDRWMTRILREQYPGRFETGGGALTPRQYERLHEEAVTHFGRYAGYAQQLLFKMGRDGRGRKW